MEEVMEFLYGLKKDLAEIKVYMPLLKTLEVIQDKQLEILAKVGQLEEIWNSNSETDLPEESFGSSEKANSEQNLTETLRKITISLSTSRKHRNFVSEPMHDKSVREIAGIGEGLGEILENAGYDKAYVVLGQFLILKKNKLSFQKWMEKTCYANKKASNDCFQCLSDWCDEFL